jgi:hypothetical protein
MVQNSKEGTPSGIAFGWDTEKQHGGSHAGTGQSDHFGKVNGYYYNGHAQAATACPGDWSLPTKAEALEMASEVNANRALLAKWWSNDDFAGSYSVTSNVWSNWRNMGYWFTLENPGAFTAQPPYINGISDHGEGLWMSVRCVQ